MFELLDFYLHVKYDAFYLFMDGICICLTKAFPSFAFNQAQEF